MSTDLGRFGGSEMGDLHSGMSSFSQQFAKQNDFFKYMPAVEDKGQHSIGQKGDRRIDDRRLRACLRCKMLKTLKQFEDQGCHNCPSYLQPKDREPDDAANKTTTNFEGMVCVCTSNKGDSWVCRWQDLNQRNLVPGAYAITMNAEEAGDEYDDESYDGTEEDEDIGMEEGVKQEVVKSETKHEVKDEVVHSEAESTAQPTAAAANDDDMDDVGGWGDADFNE